MDQHFGPLHRIRKSREFQVIYRDNAKIETPFFVLYYRTGAKDRARLGLSVSRKIGPAVVRNRVKRLFREVFRRHRAEVPGVLDLVLNARRRAAAASYPEIEAEYLRAMAELRAKGTVG